MTQTMRERLIAAAVNAPRAVGHEAHMQAVVGAILSELRTPLDPEADAMALIAGRAELPEFDEPTQEDAQNCFTAMIDHVRAG